MLYVDTGGLNRCYTGGQPPNGEAEAGCKLQLYGKKLLFKIQLWTKSLVPNFKYQSVLIAWKRRATYFNNYACNF